MPSFAIEIPEAQRDRLKRWWHCNTDAEIRTELQRFFDDYYKFTCQSEMDYQTKK